MSEQCQGQMLNISDSILSARLSLSQKVNESKKPKPLLAVRGQYPGHVISFDQNKKPDHRTAVLLKLVCCRPWIWTFRT